MRFLKPAIGIGFSLMICGALSFFLLPTLTAALLGLLAGDPRYPGLVLITAGLVLITISIVFWRRQASPARLSYWQAAMYALSLTLAVLYITRSFILPPFRHENVRFVNGEVALAGTLLIPLGPGPHPAVILHRGQGSVFDESRWGSYPLGNLFVRRGIAALFYDRRGYGGSSGKGAFEASFDELAGDSLAGLSYLLNRPEIDKDQIGLLGISHSGWVVPLVASRSGNVAFMIVWSGGGVRSAEEFIFDARLALEDAGFLAREVDQTLPEIMALRERINAYYRTGEGHEEVLVRLRQAQQEPWFKALRREESSSNRPEQPGAVPLPTAQEICQYGSRCAVSHLANWDFDPVPVLQGLDIPMLFIFGAKDRITPSIEMADRLERAFLQNGSRDVEIVLLPNAGHTMVDWSAFPRYIPGFEELITGWSLEHISVPSQ